MKIDLRFTIYDLRFQSLKTLVLVCFLFLAPSVFGQDFKRQYRQAQDLFQSGNYNLAMEAFKPLMIYDRENPYPEYASFYYAVSAYQMGFTKVSKDMFLQIKKLYPMWDKQDEVNYWLTKIYFDQGEIFQAMLTATQIKDASFQNDIKNLKTAGLAKLTDTETLKMLLEENPSDEIVAKSLVKALAKQEFPNQELALLDSLIGKYNFPRDQYISERAYKPVLKDRYQIALLFPFLANTLEPSPSRKKNQVILELYQGMKLAADTLTKSGMPIDLLSYDTERNPEVVRQLLQLPELKGVDLIVGPIYPEGQTQLQEFSNKNNINLVVSPFSNNLDLTVNNPYSILFQPSYETIGIRSAELVAEKTSNKNCLVYFGETPKDSVMAFSFIKRALELGVKVVWAEEMRRETSAKILTTLATPTEYDEYRNPIQFKLKKDSIGSIFVASDEALIYTKVINSTETRGDSVLVVGQESWLEDGSVDLHKFERILVALASPNFSPANSQDFLTFRKSFLRRHGVLPTDNAKLGYEFIMTMGKVLNEYGVYFQPFLLEAGKRKGTLTTGYSFQPIRDNGVVPFVSFRGGELVIIKE